MKQQNYFFQQLLFLTVGFLIILIPLAPINLLPKNYPTPDILLCLIFSCSARNRKSYFIFSILILSLLADFLWMRPLGLWTLFTLICIEISHRNFFHKTGVLIRTEIIIFSIMFTGMIIFINLVYFLSMMALPNLKMLLTYWLLTLLIYPFFAIFFLLIEKFRLKRRAF